MSAVSWGGFRSVEGVMTDTGRVGCQWFLLAIGISSHDFLPARISR
jgi:hypothetical protein